MKKIILWGIGVSTAVWWISFLFLPYFNIYPINNLMIGISASAVGFSVMCAIAIEYQVHKSLQNILDFIPNIKAYINLNKSAKEYNEQIKIFYSALKRFYVA